MSNNAHDLSNRLLNALDNNYNVVDMHTVNEIISILEKINITKELLETTRLGKHVNELRRKTTDPTLARRAKVLVKRWRDLVIPNKASPAHTGSNRSSAERQVRRLGGTPLTSPALSRVFSPALVSPRPPSRPAWGGYESDSQDVILVDDDPPAAPPAPPTQPPPPPPTLTTSSPAKRPVSPAPVQDEKKSKRDKKPKKRRGHSRAGAGTETTTAEPASSTVPVGNNSASASANTGSVEANTGSVASNTGSVASNTGSVAANTGTAWGNRNGAHEPRERHERRRNGCRDSVDPYAALVNKMPQAGAKKVKTTKELLEQIQSRGAKLTSPGANEADDDVVLVEDEVATVKVESPLRNGESEEAALETKAEAESRAVSPFLPLEDETEYVECTCGDTAEENCAAAVSRTLRPIAVHALHHGLLAGVNGTRAKPHPHRFAVRPPYHAEHSGLFNSVVPLYKYSDYADDYCVKNLSRVPLCEHIPWTEFAPPPPDLPPPPSPPPLRPYPVVDAPLPEEANAEDIKMEVEDVDDTAPRPAYDTKIGPEPVSLPHLEPSDRLKAPILSGDDERHIGSPPPTLHSHLAPADHRTVPRTKPEPEPDLGIPDKTEEFNGTVLRDACAKALTSVPYAYAQADSATEVKRGDLHHMTEEELTAALVPETDERDELGRPSRARRFAEWHECATLGDLIALPYVVID